MNISQPTLGDNYQMIFVLAGHLPVTPRSNVPAYCPNPRHKFIEFSLVMDSNLQRTKKSSYVGNWIIYLLFLHYRLVLMKVYKAHALSN